MQILRRALKNSKGLTLIEVLIAMVVFLLVSLAMMQTALVGIDANVINFLRDEAVGIAEMRMNQARSGPFESLVSDTSSLGGHDCPPNAVFLTGEAETRSIRNISNFEFCTNLNCRALGTDPSCNSNNIDPKQITITIGWRWKGENYTHSISTIRKR